MATSTLQRRIGELLHDYLGPYASEIVENSRPDWLITPDGERLEIDFYVPSLDLAIEVQGRQHYEFTPFFHQTPADFERQVRRDTHKREMLQERGITLLECDSEQDFIPSLEPIVISPPRFTPKPAGERASQRCLVSILEEDGIIPYGKEVRIARHAFQQTGDLDLAIAAARLRNRKREQAKAKSDALWAYQKKQMRQKEERKAHPPVFTVRRVDEHWWLVFGGTVPHAVTLTDAGYRCDCSHNPARYCTHIWHVTRSEGAPQWSK